MPDMFDEEKEQQKQDDLRVAAEYRQFQKDIKDTFSTLHGQRVLKYILEHGKTFTSIFTGNSKTYYLAGVQDFSRDIIANEVLAADFETYITVMQQIVAERKMPDAKVSDS